MLSDADIRCGKHWELSWVSVPRLFFQALPQLVDFDSIIYFESYEPRKEFRDYIVSHRAPKDRIKTIATAATIRPRWKEHLVLSPSLLQDIERFYGAWNFVPADHIHCYRSGELLFWYHDAFFDAMRVSLRIPQTRVEAFCAAQAPIFSKAEGI